MTADIDASMRGKGGSSEGLTGQSGSVCILSRKELRNITRVPRMAKALTDAGIGVVVVSMGAPVAGLRALSRGIEYIEVAPRPFTTRVLNYFNGCVLAQTTRRTRRARRYVAAAASGGWLLCFRNIQRVARLPMEIVAAGFRGIVLAPPCALLTARRECGFAAAWREAVRQPSAALLSGFVRAAHRQMLTRAFAAAADKATRGHRFEVVQAHDNYALVAASRLARRDRARLIYDAVELTEHRLGTSFTRLERFAEAYDRRQEAAIFRRADAVVTVGKGVGDWYVRQHGIATPLVVRNCREFWSYAQDHRLRDDIGVGAETPVVVWFGGIYPEQGVETLIDVVPLLTPQAHVAVVAYALPRWRRYVDEELPGRAKERGVADRVHILAPRDPQDLVPYVSGASIGVIPRPSGHPNNFFSMPNKFLEMIMARLPVAVSRLGDVVEAVAQLRIGESFDETDLADMARVINRMLDPQVNKVLKANVMTAATEMTWERERVPYVARVKALMRDGVWPVSEASPLSVKPRRSP